MENIGLELDKTRQANDDKCDRWAGGQEAELRRSYRLWDMAEKGGSDSTRGDRNSTEKVKRTIGMSATARPKLRVGMQALSCCEIQQLDVLSSQEWISPRM